MAYRILSLDGGGAWALIEVRALMTLFGADAKGHQVLAEFDLVAANSGGSLVLGGLVENLSLGDLLGYFEDEAKRRAIFSPTSSWGDRVLRDLTGMGPKYSAKNKLVALQNLLPERGNRLLTKAADGVHRTGFADNVHLLIIGFDYDRNTASFFRSAPAAGPQWGHGETASVTLAEAIHASTNAPVNYFDAPAMFPDGPGRFWDGGVTGCNNPVLAAVTEAIVMGQKPADIAALSLGTATVVLPWPTPADPPKSPYVQATVEPGLVTDLRKLATSILDDPPDVASFLAHVMTGSGAGVRSPAMSRIVRMNPLISPMGKPGQWRAPGPLDKPMTAAQFTHLVDLDMDAVQQAEVDAIAAFADLWIGGNVSNQPLRMHRDSLAPELGYGSFQEAVAAWNAVK
ncbi:MAG: patatin-like phospholipase family protein [Proteobacteria bacterium]|nr:patatin-like phospholipase family protein [Pseudomonadota bacterium]MBI3497094.1 patatin-like phospholipase family protein [Pseudomonadota bacterium]